MEHDFALIRVQTRGIWIAFGASLRQLYGIRESLGRAVGSGGEGQAKRGDSRPVEKRHASFPRGSAAREKLPSDARGDEVWVKTPIATRPRARRAVVTPWVSLLA